MGRIVRVSAPSRLHFGLLRFASDSERSFGGLGMMIDQPRTVVEVSESAEWQDRGLQSQRAREFAQLTLNGLAVDRPAALSIQVIEAPPPHTGLGSGTQLALATARAVCELCGQKDLELQQLVEAVGRGGRSAVGSYGFQDGGMIWERGKSPGEHLGELDVRLRVPHDWRIVLIEFPLMAGLSGKDESDAFSRLPKVPVETTSCLIKLAEEQILPAIEQGKFNTFANAIYEYGIEAGNCFAQIQGGPFATEAIAAGVKRLRSLGIHGVGQSSWGPSTFSFCESPSNAQELMEELGHHAEFEGAAMSIVSPDNAGAVVEDIPPA